MRACDLLAEACRRQSGGCGTECWALGSNDEQDSCLSGAGCGGIAGVQAGSHFATFTIGCHFHLPLPYPRDCGAPGEYCDACNRAVAETFGILWPGQLQGGLVYDYRYSVEWPEHWQGTEPEEMAAGAWAAAETLIGGFRLHGQKKYATTRERLHDIEKKFGIQGTVPSFRHYFTGVPADLRPPPPRPFGPQERHQVWLPLLGTGRRRHRPPVGPRHPREA